MLPPHRCLHHRHLTVLLRHSRYQHLQWSPYGFHRNSLRFSRSLDLVWTHLEKYQYTLSLLSSLLSPFSGSTASSKLSVWMIWSSSSIRSKSSMTAGYACNFFSLLHRWRCVTDTRLRRLGRSWRRHSISELVRKWGRRRGTRFRWIMLMEACEDWPQLPSARVYNSRKVRRSVVRIAWCWLRSTFSLLPFYSLPWLFPIKQ